jgi:hypothetical protein
MEVSWSEKILWSIIEVSNEFPIPHEVTRGKRRIAAVFEAHPEKSTGDSRVVRYDREKKEQPAAGRRPWYFLLFSIRSDFRQ